MAEIAFVRLAEVINRKQDMRVVSVTVKPTIADCSGTIYFTDLMLQEGPALTGYTPHTEPFLKKLRVDSEVKAPVWFNGVVRGEETVILFNLGETSAGLDVHIYPKSDMDGGSIELAQGQVHHGAGVHHKLHRDAFYHGHPPAGWVRGDGMGRPSLRDEVDAGWLRLLLSGWRRLSTGNRICVS